MSLCRQTVEDRLLLERMPLASTFGSPLDLHVRYSLCLQGPVDPEHHRVELLIAYQQWFPMIVHNLIVHPGALWLVESEQDLLIACPGNCGQLCFDCPQSFNCNGVLLAQCLHLETLAFLLRHDLLWGWLDVWVRAMPMLTWSRLLPCPSRRHHARKLLRSTTRGVCWSSAALLSLVCAAARRDRTRLL